MVRVYGGDGDWKTKNGRLKIEKGAKLFRFFSLLFVLFSKFGELLFLLRTGVSWWKVSSSEQTFFVVVVVFFTSVLLILIHIYCCPSAALLNCLCCICSNSFRF